ncbi:hypothetical protein F4819DRAFT_492670 [Hypoxylon fuscum]|nr:hypothetical protein F4819DRAFT_492670 [Hypoxylon fuscum]
MDPFSAIGLAGNIITFVDFGYKILSGSKEIYTSASGASTLNHELALDTQTFQGVVASIQEPHTAGSVTEKEQALRRFAVECGSVASDLKKLLDELKARDPTSKRDSLRAAIRDWRKGGKKDELRLKLARCRDQLNLQITELMR